MGEQEPRERVLTNKVWEEKAAPPDDVRADRRTVEQNIGKQPGNKISPAVLRMLDKVLG